MACADIYEPVKQKYVDICKEIYKAFTEILEKVKALEDKNLAEINSYTNEVLKEYIKTSTEKIQSLPTSCLQQKDGDIVRQISTETISRHTTKVEEMYTLYYIAGDLHLNSAATFYYSTNGIINNLATTYDHTKACCSRFTDNLKKLNLSLVNVAIEHKKKLLFGKYMDEHVHRTILLSNPNIEFMKSDLVNDRMLCEKAFMTVETYEKNYAPFLKEAVESLEKKGYISKDMFVINVLRIENNFTNYDVVYNGDCSDVHFNNLIHLLGRRVMKIFCREFVKGTTFAEELYPSPADKILSKKPNDIRKW